MYEFISQSIGEGLVSAGLDPSYNAFSLTGQETALLHNVTQRRRECGTLYDIKLTKGHR